jgi:hypothetical protein
VQSDYFRAGLEFHRSRSVAGWVYRERRAALRRDLDKEQQYFNRRSFLQEVANQVAIAIANMQSHEEIAPLNTKITRAAQRSRTLLEINNAIITSLSQESLLQSISKVLRGVVPRKAPSSSVYCFAVRLHTLRTPGIDRGRSTAAGIPSECPRPGRASPWGF